MDKMSLPTPSSDTDSMNQGSVEYQASHRMNPGLKVPLPNGKFAALDDLIDQDYRPGVHTSIFADPKKFMIEPRSDCLYAWVAYQRPAELMGKIRSGSYRPVGMDEVIDDADIPLATHKIAGQEFVTVYDVALVEVQPEAVRRLYKWREQTAITKVVRNVAFNEFSRQLSNATGGMVNASFEVKEQG